MSAFTRREFDELFPDRTLTARYHVTGQTAARLKVTIEDGWEPDRCYLCDHEDAYDECESCEQPVCSDHLILDMEGGPFCLPCAEAIEEQT